MNHDDYEGESWLDCFLDYNLGVKLARKEGSKSLKSWPLKKTEEINTSMKRQRFSTSICFLSFQKLNFRAKIRQKLEWVVSTFAIFSLCLAQLKSFVRFEFSRQIELLTQIFLLLFPCLQFTVNSFAPEKLLVQKIFSKIIFSLCSD